MAKLIKHRWILAAIVTMASAIFTSCNNENCYGNSNGIPLAAFYNDDETVTISNLTVYGIGAPNDSAIISNSSASQVYLPFRITTGSCQYVLNYNNQDIVNDTIGFEYDVIPYFESRECGAMYNFEIKEFSHTTNAIDSITIVNSMITNSDVVTIKIHFQ